MSPDCAECRDRWAWGCSPAREKQHTCAELGPKTRFGIFKALVVIAHMLYAAPSWSRNYVAEEQRDHLMYRLATEFPEKAVTTQIDRPMGFTLVIASLSDAEGDDEFGGEG